MRWAGAVLAALASTTLTGAVPSQAAAPAGFGYPVRPFHREHPIRAYLGEARTSFRGPPTRRTLMKGGGAFVFHDGVDVYAPNGTAVYPVVSGTVSSVRVHGVRIDTGNGNGFGYWHIKPLVAVGQHVDAYRTVLGHITRPEMHVHLIEYRRGSVVNPLVPGRLGPFTDTTRPQVRSITFVSANGSTLLPSFVRGRIRLLADARDVPTMRVPGIWRDMPTIPALVTWRMQRRGGEVVVPQRTAVDFRAGVPPNKGFWTVYARGTYQNMAVFGKHYSYLQPGAFVFRLTRTPFDTRRLPDGVYQVVVTATDLSGNRGSLSQPITIHNGPGWVGP